MFNVARPESTLCRFWHDELPVKHCFGHSKLGSVITMVVDGPDYFPEGGYKAQPMKANLHVVLSGTSESKPKAAVCGRTDLEYPEICSKTSFRYLLMSQIVPLIARPLVQAEVHR